MARVLGEARVSVLPDGTRFKPEAEALLKKASAGLKATAKLGVTLDEKELKAQQAVLQAQIEKLKSTNASIRVDINDTAALAKLTAIRAEIVRLSHTTAKATTDVDIAQAQAKIAALIARLDKFGEKKATATADINVQGTKALNLERVVLDAWGRMHKTATADVNTSRARSNLSSLVSFISGPFSRDMANRGGNAGNKFGGGFVSGLGKSALMQNPGITAAVIAGLGALPAAVGAVGVLGGIALGAGIVFGAEKLIQSKLKTLTAQIKTETAVLNSKTSTDAQKKAAEEVIKADEAQVAALNKEMAAFSRINAAVSRLKDAFLNFAVTASKPLIKPFADAIDRLSAQLNGPLRTSFTKLFTAVAPLIRPVETALLEIVQGILPGLTEMLTKARKPLSDLFTGFGRIVGLKIGDWFKAAIPYIQASSVYFLKLVSALGSTVTWLIRFGGESAKAFGGPEFQGFGKIISQIANDLLKIVIPAFTGWADVMAPVIRDLALILLPLLNFLAANPRLVKAIAGLAAAWYLAAKAVAAVNIVLGIMDLELTPIGVLFVGVAAAVAVAAILIVKNWKPISAFFVNIWNHIYSGFISPLVNFFTNTVPHAFGVTINWLKKNWPLLLPIILGPFGLVLGGIIKYHTLIFNTIKTAWGHVENVITGTVKPIVSVVVGAWNEVYKITHDIWNALWKVIQPIVLIIVGLIGEAWRGIRNLTGIVWKAVYTDIVQPLSAAWNWVNKNFLAPIGRAFRSIFDAIVKVTVEDFKGVYNFITHTLSAAWSWVNRNFLTPIGRAFRAIFDAIVKVTVEDFKGIYNFITHTLSAVWNWVYKNFLVPIGRNFRSVWGTLVNLTKTTFNLIHDYILSPLNKAWTWISHTFVAGVEGAFNGLVRTVKGIWNGLKKVVEDPINVVIDIWNKFAGFVNTGLKVFGVTQRLNQNVGHLHFAKGGHVPGYAPGKDVVPAMLSPGEFVLRPEVVKNVGVKNLHALNKVGANPTFKPYVPPTAPPLGNVGKGDKPIKRGFANGGEIEKSMLNFMLSKRGQRYSQADRWGEPPWDCSSLVWQAAAQAGVPIPKSQAIANLEANWFRNSAWAKQSHDYAVLGRSQVQPGDIVFMRGAEPDPSTFGPVGHVGMALGSDSMISALGSKYGVTTSSIDGFQGAIRLGGPGGNDVLAALGKAALGALELVLKPVAQLALSGVQGLLDSALSHLPGKGPFHDLPKAVMDKILNAAKAKITGNQNNYDQVGGGGGGPAGGATGSANANAREGYKYLLDNLFSGHKIAAAGAVASIYGESGWNPFAQGSGGRGLIGWTPPGKISDATFKGGMRTQLPAIIDFVRSNGDLGVIGQMNRATSVLQAANEWGHGVERFGVSDVHPFGVRLAEQIMAGMANGGLVGPVFDRGGTLSPGTNVVRNLTGRPESLVPESGSQNIKITLELGPNFKRQTGLTEQELADIRYTVRTKGGRGSDAVQKAFGGH